MMRGRNNGIVELCFAQSLLDGSEHWIAGHVDARQTIQLYGKEIPDIIVNGAKNGIMSCLNTFEVASTLFESLVETNPGLSVLSFAGTHIDRVKVVAFVLDLIHRSLAIAAGNNGGIGAFGDGDARCSGEATLSIKAGQRGEQSRDTLFVRRCANWLP